MDRMRQCKAANAQGKKTGCVNGGKSAMSTMGTRTEALEGKTGFWKGTGCATGTRKLSQKIMDTVLGKKRWEGMRKGVLHRQAPTRKKGKLWNWGAWLGGKGHKWNRARWEHFCSWSQMTWIIPCTPSKTFTLCFYVLGWILKLRSSDPTGSNRQSKKRSFWHFLKYICIKYIS